MNDKYDQCLIDLQFKIAGLLFPDTLITKIQLEVIGAWMDKANIYTLIRELNPNYRDPCCTSPDLSDQDGKISEKI